ncbi:hypothetical protein F3K40_31750 [Streptomyces sp. LBUM 1478]|nr:hypothetical protein [Streptomyces sp. LBUM 1478]
MPHTHVWAQRSQSSQTWCGQQPQGRNRFGGRVQRCVASAAAAASASSRSSRLLRSAFTQAWHDTSVPGASRLLSVSCGKYVPHAPVSPMPPSICLVACTAYPRFAFFRLG